MSLWNLTPNQPNWKTKMQEEHKENKGLGKKDHQRRRHEIRQ